MSDELSINSLNVSLEKVKDLIIKGLDIEHKDSYGDTPLQSAVENGHMDIVKLLIEKGANVNAKNIYGDTPLMTGSKSLGKLNHY
jgi:ankyrin repeat protein